MFIKKYFLFTLFALSNLFVINSYNNVFCFETVESEESSKEAMMRDLEAARHSLSLRYAPQEWKEELYGWTLDQAFERAKERIMFENSMTTKGFQRVFKDFLQSTRDYHVQSLYYSTEWSMFPLQIRGVDGRYFVKADFNCDYEFDVPFDFSEISFPVDKLGEEWESKLRHLEIRAGDEILALNGVPIHAVVEQLIDEELSGDRTPTGYALAEKMVFMRMGKYGQNVPSGLFTLTMLRQKDSEPISLELPWIHAAEYVEEPKQKAIEKAGKETPLQRIVRLLSQDFKVGLAQDMISCNPLKQLKEESPYLFDHRMKGFLPRIGRIVWENEKNHEIYAYLSETRSGKRLGYIYLYSFSVLDAEEVMNELVEVLHYFNRESDALVFDITDNPGGDLFFMYAVLSLLTDRPLEVPKHRELLIQEDVYQYAALYHTLKLYDSEEEADWGGYSVDAGALTRVSDYAKFIVDSWKEGHRFTEPSFLFGIDRIMPHPQVQYVKPMILLTNELDFSCADFFPAILQDNHRATVFGKKTAGAGGYVKSYPHLSRFGVRAFTLTGSIAYRLDGTPIENLGVTPDVPYELTQRDLTQGYVDYVQALNGVIDRL